MYKLFHKGLFSRAIKVLLLKSCGKKIKCLTVKYSRNNVDERVKYGTRSGLGQAKKQRLFKQTEVGIALVCGEAGNDAS